MRVWLDADNAPHVLVLMPVLRELERRGHEVMVTARERASTCRLLDLYGMPYIRVGGPAGRGFISKASSVLLRAHRLAQAATPWSPDVSFAHGSRSLPMASSLMGVPTVTMFDYEWVDARVFNLLCTVILLPDVIGPEGCAEAGIDAGKVTFYPGLKEHLYLEDARADPRIFARLGLAEGALRVLLRPPAVGAHYHNPEAEMIMDSVMDVLLCVPEARVVWLGRGSPPPRRFAGKVTVPERVYPGPAFVPGFDAVVGGGGTMTREAAVLGVPSYSFFRGRQGAVDSWLEGRGALTMLRSPEEAEVLAGLRRSRAGRRSMPLREPLPVIVDAILDAGGTG